MQEKEFKNWMLGRDFSLATITRTLSYLRYIERLGLDIDKVQSMDEIMDFFAKLRNQGVTRKTLNNHIKVLNRYFQFRGIDIHLKYYREFRDETIIIMSDDEVRKILSVRWPHIDVDRRNHAMLELLFATGVRINELIQLNWSDLYFQKKEKVWMLKVRQGKWGKSREIPVPPKVIKSLDAWRSVQVKTDPNAMFTTTQGRISHAYARNIITEAGKRAGVPYFHAHLARHWRAVKWLEQGLDLDIIKTYLGHSSVKVTQIYFKMREHAKMIEETKKKDRFFGSWEQIQPMEDSGGDNK